MASDVIVNKIAIIERCLARVEEVYADNPENLSDFTKQDSIILNIQRAVEATIDIAMHIVASEKWGLPQSSRDAFEMLHEKRAISQELLTRMNAMVGFRNVAIYSYQKINLDIVQRVIEHHLADFLEYIQAIKTWA